MRLFILSAMLLLTSLTTTSSAAILINVGEHVLLPNKPNQTIEIRVSGGDLVQGLSLNAQVGDGGPELADFGGSVAGPAIENIDILGTGIFASNNTGIVNPELGLGSDYKQFEVRTTTTASGFVNANGVLAILTIDTTGFDQGTWSLALGQTVNGPTDFAGLSATIVDGSISIVPELSSALLLIGVLPLVLLARIIARRCGLATREC